jgi:CheY-like chemotaxis protein
MRNIRVLLVDDSVWATENMIDYLQFMEPKLRQVGLEIEVLAASSFSMAIRLLQEGRFGLIIADYNLGDHEGNGLDLVQKIRNGEFEKGELGTPATVPAIAMTAHAMQSIHDRLQWWFNLVVTKPLLPRDIPEAICRVLEIEQPPDFSWRPK